MFLDDQNAAFRLRERRQKSVLWLALSVFAGVVTGSMLLLLAFPA
jgi:hypothetical protein